MRGGVGVGGQFLAHSKNPTAKIMFQSAFIVAIKDQTFFIEHQRQFSHYILHTCERKHGVLMPPSFHASLLLTPLWHWALPSSPHQTTRRSHSGRRVRAFRFRVPYAARARHAAAGRGPLRSEQGACECECAQSAVSERGSQSITAAQPIENREKFGVAYQAVFALVFQIEIC